MNTPPIQYARSADGTSIACTVVGEGPPLLILGALGVNTGYPLPWHSSLMYDFRHSIFDRRGSGRSGPCGSASMDGLVQDAVAVVDHLGFRSFHIFAFAFGCLEAIGVALTCPERVRGLVLVNPMATDWVTEPWRKAWLAALENDWEYFADVSFRTFGTAEQPPPPELVRQFQETHSADGFRGVVAAFSRANRVDLSLLSVPVLVIGRARRGRDALEAASQHASEIPGAMFVIDHTMDFWRLGPETERPLRDFFVSTTPSAEIPTLWGVHHAEPTVAANESGLSDREREVLKLIAGGRSNAQIAQSLTVSLPTVATHLRHIFDKVGVENRAGAAAWAVREGLA